ncbi:MAG: glycosyltransferase family 4 protein [Caldilineaceae bacterium]|nr:glycosyltransferase family 4 protein [Caldilineaceae bacterium]MDE0336292.1 glycosyltransferase family 4 protein [Caldilineaceae bacterium]
MNRSSKRRSGAPPADSVGPFGDSQQRQSEGATVALLTMDFPPSVGGVQRFLFELSRRVGRHCRLTVAVPQGDASLFQEEPFSLISLPSSMPWHYARVLATLRPHVTIVGHAHPRMLLPAALLSRKRFIGLALGNDFEVAQRRSHAPIFNRLLASAHPLVTISRANSQRLQYLGLPAPEILYPGTHPDRFTPPAVPPAGPPVLLTVARLVPRKGIDIVLQSLPQLLDKWPHLQYWIVGNGPSRPSLAQMIQKLGVTNAVRFLEEVSDSELPQIYRRATVFVMPVRTDYHDGGVEGFGIVYLEASASGLPVVAARSGGAPEALIENETGLIVPPDDPAALTQALIRLLEDPDLRQRMGRAGRRWVETEMNWDRVGRQFLSIIERTL